MTGTRAVWTLWCLLWAALYVIGAVMLSPLAYVFEHGGLLSAVFCVAAAGSVACILIPVGKVDR